MRSGFIFRHRFCAPAGTQPTAILVSLGAHETISEALRVGSIPDTGESEGRLIAIDTKPARRRQPGSSSNFACRANQLSILSSPSRKNNPLNLSGKSKVKSRHPVPREGRWPSSRTLGQVVVDAAASRASAVHRAMFVSERERARRATLLRTAKPCGPDTRCWCQVVRRRSHLNRDDQPLIRQRR